MRSLTLPLFLALLMVSVCAHSQEITEPAPVPTRSRESQSESGPHFARARELYALGPAKAKEVIAELDLELREHPENVKAFLLKAMTQMGTEQLDAALATLDQLSEVASKTETIYPSAVYLRARCLFYKGEYESAKRTLEPFWAFFQDDAERKRQYDSLMVDITAKTQKPNDQ
jgi:tetratricopeptide (TPR) repeat protein